MAREPFFDDSDSDGDTIHGADNHNNMGGRNGKRGPRYERNQRKREKG